MTFTFLKIIGIGFILSVSTLANATLIDNGDYTTDTESGLDWLDWTETLSDTQSEALAEFSGDGWRIATATEALGLLENHFGVPDDWGNDRNSADAFVDYLPNHFKFLEMFGGFALNGMQPASHATIEGAGIYGSGHISVLAGAKGGYEAVGFKRNWSGVALVKAAAVSEPAFIALYALGLVGIGFARRRQS
jgi:hypothetical protein